MTVSSLVVVRCCSRPRPCGSTGAGGDLGLVEDLQRHGPGPDEDRRLHRGGGSDISGGNRWNPWIPQQRIQGCDMV